MGCQTERLSNRWWGAGRACPDFSGPDATHHSCEAVVIGSLRRGIKSVHATDVSSIKMPLINRELTFALYKRSWSITKIRKNQMMQITKQTVEDMRRCRPKRFCFSGDDNAKKTQAKGFKRLQTWRHPVAILA
jgi:hypothetical protein